MPEPSVAPLTPDFARYRWCRLGTVGLNDDWVTCRWQDGVEQRFYGLWLWENSVGRGIDPTTRELMVDPVDLPYEPVIAAAAVADDGALEITWSDRTASRVHPGWLRSVAAGDQLPSSALAPYHPWPIDDWAKQRRSVSETGARRHDGTPAVFPPMIAGDAVLHDDAVLEAWLEAAIGFGVALLTGVGTQVDFLEQLAERIGPIRSTNFGAVFSVRSVIEPTAEENSVANTGLMLGQHTDLPSRETPPGFQLLHCVANTTEGGWASMTDGTALVERLKTESPDDFAALTTLRWVFANRSPDADHRWSGPMIELAESGRPLTLRCFYPVRAYPDMAEADIPRSYAAMRRFSALSRQLSSTIRFPYSPGDVVIFDNRRVLHGRDSFDPSCGERHLRGCYLDHDDVFSRARILRRRREFR